MKMRRSFRWLLLALAVLAIPASSYAGVFLSVGFAPPALPVYAQPVCPQPGLMWTPGFWDYGPDGYFWVPGAWVPAPYEGALWTPPYWGWSGGLYVFHPGYWGRHVGYYGGVNYGFGYMGIGFVGGAWRGGIFAYNSAVMHVGVGGGWGNRVYADRTIVERNTVFNNNRVAFSGGPGGVNHPATAEERIAEHDRHVGQTNFQSQHMAAARANRTAYARTNGGRPQNLAAQSHSFTGAGARAGSADGAMHARSGFNPGRTTTTTRIRTTTTTQSYRSPHSAQYARPAAQPHAAAPRAEARPGGQPRGGEKGRR